MVKWKSSFFPPSICGRDLVVLKMNEKGTKIYSIIAINISGAYVLFASSGMLLLTFNMLSEHKCLNFTNYFHLRLPCFHLLNIAYSKKQAIPKTMCLRNTSMHDLHSKRTPNDSWNSNQHATKVPNKHKCSVVEHLK